MAGPAEFDAIAGRLGSRAIHADRSALTIGVASDGSAASIRAVLDEIDPDGQRVDRFAARATTLDEVFLALTGQPAQKETSHV
jgi:ABC-2 type transport system ATP-binding protein